MNILKEMAIEESKIKKCGFEIIGYYNLVSNYGFKIKLNNQEYDLRHWKNCYGAEVNYWEVSPKCRASEEDRIKLEELEEIMMGR